MRAQNLFDAFDTLDAELVYDAHAKPPVKRYMIRHMALAAAIFVVVLTSAFIYGAFVAPASRIWLDSKESVMITLNSRRNVLSATDRPELTGKSAEEAVAAITQDMLESGTLNNGDNTLILGVSKRNADLREQLGRSVTKRFDEERFEGCLVTVVCDDADVSNDRSPSRAAVIRLLSTDDDSMNPRALKDFSCNQLCLLLVQHRQSDDVTVTGTPSESAYIGFDKATERAVSLCGFTQEEMSGVDITYSVYHGKLIYLVILHAGESSEAYFVNAATGAVEQAVKAPSSSIDTAIGDAFESPLQKTDPTQSAIDVPITPSQAPKAEPTVQTAPSENTGIHVPPFDESSTDTPAQAAATIPVASPPTLISPTQTPTQPVSGDYSTVPVTLKELGFVVLSPPEAAKDVPYQTLFEGQCFASRSGEIVNTGEVAVITNYAQYQAFLKNHPFSYSDQNGDKLKAPVTAEFFHTRYLLATACTVSDASYCTTVTDLKSDGGIIYMENSFTYGAAHSGEFTCHTLSLYAVSRSAASPDSSLTVY